MWKCLVEFTEGLIFFLYTLLLKGELLVMSVRTWLLFQFLIYQSRPIKWWKGGRICFALLMKNITDQSVLSCRVAASRIGIRKANKSQKEISIWCALDTTVWGCESFREIKENFLRHSMEYITQDHCPVLLGLPLVLLCFLFSVSCSCCWSY